MVVDYLVIGGGVVGLSTAFHLKRGEPGARVVLLEQATRVCAGNSARSAALYRDLFSSATSRVLASSSIGYYQTIGSSIGMRPSGYLWTFSEEAWRSSAAVAGELAAASPPGGMEILDRRGIAGILALREDGEEPASPAAAILGRRCGSLSAVALADHYAQAFTARGGEILTGREALPPRCADSEPAWARREFTDMRDSAGVQWEAGVMVAAAGCWLQDFLGPAGIASAVYPKKRQLFAIRLGRSCVGCRKSYSTA